ncbi:MULTISPECIES: aminodeoxychorismate/anthranilate synthase component II [unclassified Staphylococcus]|uniref:anthranilate synthase component II n=1 Tax=unclassified Staphylococcus TaxID=91994 RepID=UPI00194E1E60|nr:MULTISPECIES: aminodeoxychorismate/anthranilate synthase component II [unclassified Staphylococcus]
MLLVIDNKDSFTYNIVDYLKQCYTGTIKVVDVDEIDIDKLIDMKPLAIIISPGPGTPSDYPIINEVITQFMNNVPILGVCLGFQQIITYFGGRIVKNHKPIHGHTTSITHTGKGIFKDLPKSFNVMRYHSLMADIHTFPVELNVTATNDKGIIMACEHRECAIYGVQYHPESFLSEYGIEQIKLFIESVEVHHASKI